MNFYDPEAGATIDAQAASEGVYLGAPAHDASWYQGIPTGVGLGVARLAAKGTSSVYDLVNEAARPLSRGVDSLAGTGLEGWFDSMRFANYRTISGLKPDPATTGFVGQVLHGLVDLGGSAALVGPAGAGFLEGNAARGEALAKGVDSNTANQLAVTSAVTTGVSMAAPMTLGARTAVDVAKTAAVGAGVNVATGVVQRGLNHDILDTAGYKDMAKQYEALDQEAMLADGALGLLFGTGAGAIELRMSRRGQAMVDAALTSQQAKHAAVDSAPGVPADTAAAAAHGATIDASLESLLHDRPVEVPPEMVGPVFQPRHEPEKVAALDEVRAQVAEEAAMHAPAEAAPRETPHVNGEVQPLEEDWAAVMQRRVEQQAVHDERYSQMDHNQLEAEYEAARANNLNAELDVVGRTQTPEFMADFSTWSQRRRDGWIEKHATEAMDRELQDRYVNEERIREFQSKVNDFDDTSPQLMGQSLTRSLDGIDRPGWATSPNGVAVRNALAHAKEKGWDFNEITAGARERLVKLAGNDAAELYPMFFKEGGGAPKAVGVAEPALTPAAPKAIGLAPEERAASTTPPAEAVAAARETRAAAVKQVIESRPAKTEAPEIAAARAAADNRPDMLVPTGKVDEAGKPQTITARAMADYVAEAFARAENDRKAFEAAITCMLSNP